MRPSRLDVPLAAVLLEGAGSIGDRLFLSEATVSILRKLGVRDRTQVVVPAHESGLVRPGAG